MDTLVLITFDAEAKAYQGLNELKQLAQVRAIDLVEASVVERSADGKLVPKGGVGLEGSGAAKGTLLGMIFGMLGGPVGILIGGAYGALIGGGIHAAKSDEIVDGLALIGRTLKPGTTGLLAAIGEPTPDALDAAMKRIGGTVLRAPAELVQADLVAARTAEEAANNAAKKAVREERRKEHKQEWRNFAADVREKFSRAP